MILSTELVGTNHKAAAAWNRTLTLRLLRQYRSLSRRQLAGMTGLRGSTLTYIVRELIDRGVVRQTGRLKTKGAGQKQVMLEINPSAGWVLGASMRPGAAEVVLLDAVGTRIGGFRTAIAGPLPTAPDQLRSALAAWVADSDNPPAGPMIGAGVGVPGVVDADRGVVLRSTPFDAVEVPLRSLIEETFGVAAVVDHDACFGACAEAIDGAAKGSGHFLYLLVNHTRDGQRVRFDSYGSALYLGGRVHRGAHYGAGELWATLAPPAVQTDDAGLNALRCDDGPLPPDLADLAAAIGRSVAGVVNLVDLQAVVVGGTAGIKNRRFIAAVRDLVNQQLVPVPGRTTEVVVTRVASQAMAVGAALAALDLATTDGSLTARHAGVLRTSA